MSSGPVSESPCRAQAASLSQPRRLRCAAFRSARVPLGATRTHSASLTLRNQSPCMYDGTMSDAQDTSKHTNRLIHETSPYLRQHAHNPVDWYSWGEEALARAKAENKPILLSIGYSACHWCHVMERESFENPDIAQIMNEHFINIKVDREERLDGAVKDLSAFYEPVNGGFGDAPKFPTPPPFHMLLRQFARTKDQKCLDMTLHSLWKMAAGGIYAPLGGGFHRYSTDGQWLGPHFEEKICDNAQLVRLYHDGWP